MAPWLHCDGAPGRCTRTLHPDPLSWHAGIATEGRPETTRARDLLAAGVGARPDRPRAGPAGSPRPAQLGPRERLQEGPGLLLGPRRTRELLALPAAERDAAAAVFLADPSPATPENELLAAIARRSEAAYGFADTPLDPRWQVAFLHGGPDERRSLDCGAIFRRFEVWSYATGEAERGSRERQRSMLHVLFFEPEPGLEWLLWDPRLHPKLDLYVDDVQFLMQYWQDYEGTRFFAERFDFQLCRPEAELLDEVTGVWAASERRRDPKIVPDPLGPPADLAGWIARALAEPAPAGAPTLPLREVLVQFPARHGAERLVTRVLLVLEPHAAPALVQEADGPRHQLELTAVLEQDGKVFDRTRWRFTVAPPEAGTPLVLAAEMPLRPGARIVARWRLADAAGGRFLRVAHAFTVPDEPVPMPDLPVPEAEVARLGAALGARALAGEDALLLVPPDSEVVLGRWRADTLVSGSRIVQVAFLLDDRLVLRVNRPPYSAELALGDVPRERAVRAEGFDAAGALVASDEVVLNQPRGALRVRILEPRRGAPASGRARVRASLVVPEGKQVARVELRVNGELAATLDGPPWESWVEVAPGPQGLAYLTVIAELTDGTRAEDVRFLGSDAFGAEETVDLVELFTTVVDRAGRPVPGLGEADFAVLEDGRPQSLRRVEPVAELPLSLGLVLDVSSSMHERIEIAKQAALGFLRSVLRPGDRAYAVAFADEARVLQPISGDFAALGERIAGLRAYGNTALHDAVATGVYYASALEGQKAVVLLSDGDDTASTMAFRQVLEYARRTGVAVYTVGVGIGSFDLAVRRKLESLSEATGGRTLFVDRAEELAAVYEDIARELRARYLLAYVSDSRAADGAFRQVEVRVGRPGLRARTVPGYYP